MIRGLNSVKIIQTHNPDMRVSDASFENMSTSYFWFLADAYPDLINRLQIQVRPKGNFGLNGSI